MIASLSLWQFHRCSHLNQLGGIWVVRHPEGSCLSLQGRQAQLHGSQAQWAEDNVTVSYCLKNKFTAPLETTVLKTSRVLDVLQTCCLDLYVPLLYTLHTLRKLLTDVSLAFPPVTGTDECSADQLLSTQPTQAAIHPLTHRN